MYGLGHLFQIRAFLQTRRRIRINTVRTLYRMGNSKRDQRLFPFRQSTFGKNSTVPPRELFPQLRTLFADIRKLFEIVAMIIVFHAVLRPRSLTLIGTAKIVL